MPQEPDQTLRAHPVKLYWLATRPGFLLASLVPALTGAAAASYQGYPLHGGLLLLTLLGAGLVHAGMNVLNDYYDEQNGTDRRNSERLFPFTGGSRFIQNQVLSAAETLRFGSLLLLMVIIIGLGLAAISGAGLLGIGVAGLLLGWGYSAPPLQLNSRGWGEPSIAISFGLLI
ncbi:MAG: prenyltransferase, partial [Thiolinea sp.]